MFKNTIPPISNKKNAEILAPPFQVCETGWGSFEIGITIHTRDPTAPPIQLLHILKLFPDGSSSSTSSGGSSEKPTLSEVYDEIVFNDQTSLLSTSSTSSSSSSSTSTTTTTTEQQKQQTSSLREALYRGPVMDPPPYPFQEHLSVFTSDMDLAVIKAARTWVKDRMEEQEDRLSQRRAEAAALKKQLVSLGIL